MSRGVRHRMLGYRVRMRNRGCSTKSLSARAALLLCVAWLTSCHHPVPSPPESETEKVELTHISQTVRYYDPPDGSAPSAVLVFGSGDGGWSVWEDAVAKKLSAEQNVAVVTFDTFLYAQKPFDAKKLSADMARIAEAALSRYDGAEDAPVFYGGWSTGAEWSVAAAAVQDARPERLEGLLLIAPGERSRYGLTKSDIAGIKPTGPGSFGLADLAKKMAPLRVAQFHAEHDPMDSFAWLREVDDTPRVLFVYRGGWHDFGGVSDKFVVQLEQAMDWLGGDESAAPPDEGGLPAPNLRLGDYIYIVVVLLVFIVALTVPWLRRHVPTALALLLLTVGIGNLWASVFNKQADELDWMEQWLPFGVSEGGRLLLVATGLLQVALARGIWRRKRLAWWLATGSLLMAPLLHLERAFDWHHALVSGAVCVMFFVNRRRFTASSDGPSALVGLWVGGAALVTVLVAGWVALESNRGDISGPDSAIDTLETVVELAFLQSTDTQRPESPRAEAIFGTIRASGALALLAVAALLLRPALQRHKPDEKARADMRSLVDAHGCDPLDEFAFLPDKHLWFCDTAHGKCGVAFALWRDMAVTLSNPVGPAAAVPEAIEAFAKYCAEQDWLPVFYEVTPDHLPVYERMGFTTFKIGEDSRLDLATFSLAGKDFQDMRTARNKAAKTGQTFVWYQAQPVDHGLEAQMKVISDSWVQSKGQVSMTFDLGDFNFDDLRKHGAAVVLNAENRVEGFATWLPYAQGTGRCLDLMRARQDVKNVMDLLITESLLHFQKEGVREASLANAPLANIEETGLKTEERGAKYLFDNFNHLYGYKTLFNFKAKFKPRWQGRYVAYQKRQQLPWVALALMRVHLPQGWLKLLKS